MFTLNIKHGSHANVQSYITNRGNESAYYFHTAYITLTRKQAYERANIYQIYDTRRDQALIQNRDDRSHFLLFRFYIAFFLSRY